MNDFVHSSDTHSRNGKPEPLVSIGLPVYNGEAYLEQAVKCLQRQTYRNIEIIISDNCSTDGTAILCERLAAEDNRIRYSRTERNLGAAGNFNRVAGLAGGPFFAWANHDDLWGNTYVESCLDALRANPNAVLAYAKSEKIDEDGAHIISLNSGLNLDAARASERLKRYHDLFIGVDRRKGWGSEPVEGFWIPVYGLMRSDLVGRTRLIRNFISSDTVLIEDLLILGEFKEIDSVLFFKRDHRKRSMRDSEAYDARDAWFTGRTPTRLLMPRWKAFFARLESSVRLPATRRERWACCVETIWFYARRRSEANALVKEIIANAGRLVLGRERGAKLFHKW